MPDTRRAMTVEEPVGEFDHGRHRRISRHRQTVITAADEQHAAVLGQGAVAEIDRQAAHVPAPVVQNEQEPAGQLRELRLAEQSLVESGDHRP